MDTMPSSTINAYSAPTQQQCEICYNERISQWKILPCAHKLCCECMEKIQSCPWCRTKLVGFYPNFKNSVTSFVNSIVIDSLPRRARPRNRQRSQSDPTHYATNRRDSLFTPDEVIEYERVISTKIDKRNSVQRKKKEITTPTRDGKKRDQRRSLKYINRANIEKLRFYKYFS